jgi:hypothetical protein
MQGELVIRVNFRAYSMMLHTCCSDKFDVLKSAAGLPIVVDLRLTRKISCSESELSLYSMAEALHEPSSLQPSSIPDKVSSKLQIPLLVEVLIACLEVG